MPRLGLDEKFSIFRRDRFPAVFFVWNPRLTKAGRAYNFMGYSQERPRAMKFIPLVTLLSFLILSAFPVLAEDPAPEAAPEVNIKAAEEFKDKAEDLKKDLQDRLAALEEGLDEKQKRHFGIIYNNHNLIETVKTVRGDVEKAVNACSKNNADLSDKMTKRFEDWKTAVNTKLTEAEGLTQSMIFAQDYASSDEMKDALAAADTMRAHSQTIYDKVPVTSKEACEFLFEKMVETQDNMISLLGTTLISVPQEMQKAEDGAEEQEEPAKEESAPEPTPALEEKELPHPQDREPAEKSPEKTNQ